MIKNQVFLEKGTIAMYVKDRQSQSAIHIELYVQFKMKNLISKHIIKGCSCLFSLILEYRITWNKSMKPMAYF